MMAFQLFLQYRELTVQNFMTQFDLFQSQTIANKLSAKDESQIRISNKGKENSKKFSIFGISENSLFSK